MDICFYRNDKVYHINISIKYILLLNQRIRIIIVFEYNNLNVLHNHNICRLLFLNILNYLVVTLRTIIIKLHLIMNTLPIEIVEIIYKEKHKLEMVDLCKEINNVYKERIENCYLDIDMMFKDQYYLFEPEYILNIYTALRNVGEINDDELLDYLEYTEDKVYNQINDIVRFHDDDIMVIDKTFFYTNNDFSIYDYLKN